MVPPLTTAMSTCWSFSARSRPVDRYLAVSRLLRPRPFPLDILVKTPEEITQALQKGDAFIREIMSQGRILYERSD